MATKPHHFQSAPLSRYFLENRLEDRELVLATRKAQLDNLEEDLLERETAFRKYSGSRPQDVERIRELEAEVEHLASLNEQLKNRETKASSAAAFEWSYIEKVRDDLRRKMTSQIARDKALKDNRRALRIREYQLTENERQYELKLQSEVNKRVHSRLNHQPDLPPPTMDTISVEKVLGPAWVKTKQQSWDQLIKPGWSRYLDENIKCKFEYLANEANKHKIKFEPEQSFVFDLLVSRCGICTRRLAFLGKEDLYITCGHLHCADCIFRSTVEQPECPDCGTPIELEQLRTLFTNSN